MYIFKKAFVSLATLLFVICGTLSVNGQSIIPVSPYDFPYGYPFPDYPVAGASHPTLSGDPIVSQGESKGQVKRMAQYVLRLLQTDRIEEAIIYMNEYMEEYPGYMDEEIWFMRSMAQSHLGRLDDAAKSMQMAIEAAELPPQRFLAGPRRMFTPLHNHEAFVSLWEQHQYDLVHGPMLGDMTDSSVRVWVRTVSESPVRVVISASQDMANPIVSSPVISRSEDDYTAVMQVNGLEPNTLYYYKVVVGNDRFIAGDEEHTFRTYPAQGEPAEFQIAFGGGGGYTPFNERVWDTVRRFNPTAFFTLGDNVYIDDPESPDQQRLTYYQRQSRPEFRRLVGSSPVYAIWDDHDFGMNDSWGGTEVDVPYWKPMVWEIFQQNWVNPDYGSGEERPGGWFDFQVADVHFILLDGRYYRTANGRLGDLKVENPTMLGPHQLEWLHETLSESMATFKVLVSPVPWHMEAKPGRGGLDTWAGYQDEREEIFSWIDDHEIDGVILMAADRHRSDAWVTEREDSYNLYEFQSSQFTNIHTHPIMDESLFGYNEKNSFGLVRFNTELDDPEITYRIVDIEGKLQHNFTVKLSELTH